MTYNLTRWLRYAAPITLQLLAAPWIFGCILLCMFLAGPIVPNRQPSSEQA